MFNLEHTQNEVSQSIESLLAEDSFPSAVLFRGPEFSGRMYAAYMLASSVGESTVIVSDRDFSLRLNAALHYFEENKNKVSLDFLLLNIRIFLKQFHVSFTDDLNSHLKKKFDLSSQLGSLLDTVSSMNESSYDSFLKEAAKLISDILSIKSPAVSVDQIRAIQDWTASSSLTGKKKFVILEGLERAVPTVYNSLLKTLEEPPADTCFIIIGSVGSSLSQTVMSRLRKFRFYSLSAGATSYILDSLYADTGKIRSVRDFYYINAGIDVEKLKDAASSLVMSGECNLKSVIGELEKSKSWKFFFSLVLENLHRSFLDGRIKEDVYLRLNKGINEKINVGSLYSTPERLVFDYILLTVKESLQ